MDYRLQTKLIEYRDGLEKELDVILQYWVDHTVDSLHGGFWGQTDDQGRPVKDASKGLVLNARILWTFSAAYSRKKQKVYLSMAERAFRFIRDYFIDPEYGGVYWLTDPAGEVYNDRKQIYGMAFCIYGMSEFYRASGDINALRYARELFRLTEKYGYDPKGKGYWEAFSRDWKPVEDMRLSEKDANEKKSMNTHLHLLEAYANLYKVWPDNLVKSSVVSLLDIFESRILNPLTGHLNLFFDEAWNPKSSLVSFGHDIEAGWLLQSCAEAVNDNQWEEQLSVLSLKMIAAAREGLDRDGGLWYEYDPAIPGLIAEKHWWPQAEAMIGFFHAWQLTQDPRYLDASFNVWSFTQQYLIDSRNGEWFWGVGEDHSVMKGFYKTGIWKCPYHNARACMEISRRIDAWISQSVQ